MKAPEFRPFVVEDFPEAPWMERLIRPLNRVLGQLQAGTSNGLTFGDNLNAEIKTLDITGGRAAVPAADDTAWHLVGGAGEPAFLNSWVAGGVSGYAVPRFQRRGGVVYVEGEVKSGSTGTAVFTLPAGYRPNGHITFQAAGSGGGVQWMKVSSTGDVTLTWGASGADPKGLSASFIADDATGTAAVAAAAPKFTTAVKGQVQGVILMRALKLTDRTQTPVIASGLGWEQDGPTVILRTIGGLTEGTPYRLTVLVVGG